MNDTEVQQELEFKEYIIFPNMGFIVIHRRKKRDGEDPDALIARVGIEWEKCGLYSVVQNQLRTIHRFSSFLLEDFLQFRSVDRYETMGFVGYDPQDFDATSKTSQKAKGERSTTPPHGTAPKTARGEHPEAFSPEKNPGGAASSGGANQTLGPGGSNAAGGANSSLVGGQSSHLTPERSVSGGLGLGNVAPLLSATAVASAGASLISPRTPRTIAGGAGGQGGGGANDSGTPMPPGEKVRHSLGVLFLVSRLSQLLPFTSLSGKS